jgi:hypothetical protein
MYCIGGGREEADLHVQAELRWGWGVAWRRPRAPSQAPSSYLQQEAHVRAPRAPARLKLYV